MSECLSNISKVKDGRQSRLPVAKPATSRTGIGAKLSGSELDGQCEAAAVPSSAGKVEL